MKENKSVLVLIQNTLSSNRLLLYWDERWKCYLFPNYSYKRLEGQLLGKLIIGDLPLDNCSIEFNSLGIFKNTKFSESDQIYKNYTYNFQLCKITSCPELENIREFDYKGKHWKWMSVDEMVQDERMSSVNRDVISYVQKLEEKLWKK